MQTADVRRLHHVVLGPDADDVGIQKVDIGAAPVFDRQHGDRQRIPTILRQPLVPAVGHLGGLVRLGEDAGVSEPGIDVVVADAARAEEVERRDRELDDALAMSEQVAFKPPIKAHQN